MDQAVKYRLAQACAILQLLDLRRSQTGLPDLGRALEKQILDRELQDLEKATAKVSVDVGLPSFVRVARQPGR